MIICSPQLGLSPESALGGEVFDREILLGLAKSGVKVEIILPKGKPKDKKVKNWNITYLPISHFPAFLGNLIYIPYLFKVYGKSKFQILRIHQPQFLGLACLFFKIFRKEVILIATYHQFRETRFGPFSRIVNNQWNHIICDSLAVKKKIIETYQIAQKKITVVHNGVPKYLKPTRKNRVLEKEFKLEGKFVLLFMGLFIERKNPLFLLKVLSKLLQGEKDIVLLFWGKGPLKDKMVKEATNMKIFEHIRIINPIFGPQKNEIHNLTNIFVHPSLDEGFALAPLEAMACGKPVIMNDSYSADEAVENKKNGYLCKIGSIEDWSEKIIKLKKNKRLLRSMSSYSLKKVKKDFDWYLSVEKHIKVVNKLST